jgi:hypothetical protein
MDIGSGTASTLVVFDETIGYPDTGGSHAKIDTKYW